MSPSLTCLSKSGPGLPIGQYKVSVSLSQEPVIQADPPPYFQDSPAHVSFPGSPGAGMLYVFQAGAPVSALTAATQPLTPYSAPAVPKTIVLFTANGMIVNVSA